MKEPPRAGGGTRRRPVTLGTRIAVELIVLTVLFTLVLGAVITLSWTGRMRVQLDQRLGEVAAHIESKVQDQLSLPASVVSAPLPDVVGGEVAVFVRTDDGTVVRSIPPSAPPPPFQPTRERRFATVPAGALGGLIGEGPMRLLTRPVHGGYSVQVAMSRARLAQREEFLRGVFLLALPLAMAAASLVAWLIAGRRLDRLRQISRLAAEIKPSQMHRRLDPGEYDELGQLSDEVNRMLTRLEEGFRAQENFISEVSHELKTPVSVLMLESQILARSDPDQVAFAKFVASAEDEMRRLSKLIESFLMLARAKHGAGHVRRVPVDMNDAAMESGEHCYSYAKLRDIGLSVSLSSKSGADDEPPMVTGDPELLRTMIENLLRNAIAISPRSTPIDLRVVHQNGDVTVLVRDRGPGVPEDLAPHLFKRFVSSDHARQGRKGSGLGLTIARDIAELHGGGIEFRNIPAAEGGGAEFSARLPLEQRPPPPVV